MSAHDIEFLAAETRKLEAMGIVLGNGGTDRFICVPCRDGQHPPLHPHPRRGRKKIHASGYDRLKAHRRRKSGIRIKVTDDNEIGL